ncbi:MAG TPA: 3D domain-containing protein [Pyrinomonadaceae bacterium]|nr:3D domain-containing protein [Pyrinomonadaceae bacterium]
MFTARTSSAETLPSQTTQTQQQASKPATEAAAPVALEVPSSGGQVGKAIANEEKYAVAPASYVATAYSLRGRTASGQMVAKGLIAADPRHLPLGTRVRLEAGSYSGEYVVADTGGMVRGRRIDIWTPTSREAMRFGKRLVKLTVLSLGGKKRALR